MKYARSNFMTPIPVAASLAELNAMSAERCRRRQDERAGRHAQTIGERLAADCEALRPLPAVPLEPCEKRGGRVSSTALVRYRSNDYSVPTAYGFQDVMVKGFVEEVVVLCRGEEIARHPRSYGTGVFVADPLHYLALIEVKPNALDQAAALQGWDLPETFQHLLHLLEARMGNRGKREFIQVLRLMEALPREVVSLAVEMFRTAWFVESILTEILVIFVIRTAAPCWRSRPHRFLVMTSLGALAAALILALTPLGHPFGFVALPVPVLLAILMIAASYLGLAEMLKPLAMRTARAGPAPVASPSIGAAEQ